MIRCETSDLTLDRTLRVYCHTSISFSERKRPPLVPLLSASAALSRLYNTELYSRRLTTELGIAAGVLSAVWAGHSSIRDESRHMFLSWLRDNGSRMTWWRAPEMTNPRESIHHSDKRRRKTETFFLWSGARRPEIWDARQQLPLIIIINTAGVRPEDQA